MTALFGVGLLVLVLGGAAAIMIPAYLRQRVDWKRVPGTPYQFTTLTPLDPSVLRDAIIAAFAALRAHSDFSPDVLMATGQHLRVSVQRVNQWQSPAHGGTVAGVATGTTIYVGRDLKALCHEIAHACEFIEGGEGRVDGAHATWTKRGIFRAVDEYEKGRP